MLVGAGPTRQMRHFGPPPGRWQARVGPAQLWTGGGPPPEERVGPQRFAGRSPFDRFDHTAKHVLALSQDEAIRFNHNYIGTEHLLLGLLREGDGIAARALASLGVDLGKCRTAVEFIIGRGDSQMAPSDITLSPRTKRIIELATEEARQLGHHDVGSGHLLLGLVREGEGIGAGILQSLGVDFPAVRAKVLELIPKREPPPPPAPPPPAAS
jgi:ATP-dependent Clp protease ATP-binding subunit ClpC